jgi:Co/Zn/Cd efflux system component
MGDAHGHHHGSVGERALWLAFWLNLVFLIIELTVGLLANSLALLSDAGHMVSDVLALAIALVVMSAILVTQNCMLTDLEKAAADLREKLHHDFGIEHATFEWRTPEGSKGECEFRS